MSHLLKIRQHCISSVFMGREACEQLLKGLTRIVLLLLLKTSFREEERKNCLILSRVGKQGMHTRQLVWKYLSVAELITKVKLRIYQVTVNLYSLLNNTFFPFLIFFLYPPYYTYILKCIQQLVCMVKSFSVAELVNKSAIVIPETTIFKHNVVS
jgi:hypothetical protein